MKSLCTKQKNSKMLIQNSFCYLLEQMPYEEINISLICKQATVSRNTFYRIYDNKQQVIESIIAEKTKESVEIYESILKNADFSNSEETFLSYKSFFEYWYQHKDMLALLAEDNLYQLFYSIYSANFTNKTTNLRISKTKDPELFSKYYLSCVSAIMVSALKVWQMGGFSESTEALASIMIEIRKTQAANYTSQS